MIMGKKYPINLNIIGNSEEIIPKIIKKWKCLINKNIYLICDLNHQWNEILGNEETPTEFPVNFHFAMKKLSRYVDDDAIISVDIDENGLGVKKNFPMKILKNP